MNIGYSIKEVAELAGISVRTLHYYDQIGLLCPKQNKINQYRIYDNDDLEKLWQILFYKELDFPLSKIKEIIHSNSFDQTSALKMHKKMLLEKRKRLNNMIASIDECIKEGFDEKMISAFEQKNYEKYKKEAIDKYGDVAKESYEKIEKKSKEEMDAIIEEGQAIFKDISKLMDRNVDDQEVQLLIQKWQEHITKNYYECTDEIFKGLGELYVADERFKKNINKTKTGLAEYLSKAIAWYVKNK